MTATDFGQLVRYRRMALGWSQGQLAEATGISQHAISRYETGLYEPRLGNAIILADVLDLDLAAVQLVG